MSSICHFVPISKNTKIDLYLYFKMNTWVSIDSYFHPVPKERKKKTKPQPAQQFQIVMQNMHIAYSI